MPATLRQLAHAQALANHRSFRLAARAMHLSQPALTRSIKALEDTLGVALFDRLRAGVEPTKFGEVFLRRAAPLLLAHQDLLRDMRLLQGADTGTLSVSAGPYPGDLQVPRVAALLSAAHPALALRLRHGSWREVTAHVLARESDLGVAEISEASQDGRLRTERVGRNRIYFYCRAGHPLLKRRGAALSRIASFPWVATRVPTRLARRLGTLAGRAGTIEPETRAFVPAIEVEVVGVAKRIVAESDAIGGAMLAQIEHEVDAGTLAVIPYDAEWMCLDYGFIYLRDRTVSPAAREFMAALRDVDAALATQERTLARRYGLQPEGTRGSEP